MNKNNKFTLIELIVVLSIIMVLTSLLITALHRVKGSVESTQCANNMRQINAYMHSYISDNNNYYPDGAGTKWFSGVKVGAYFGNDRNVSLNKDIEFAICPSASGLALSPAGTTHYYDFGYGTNINLAVRSGAPFSVSRIQISPSILGTLVDSMGNDWSAGGWSNTPPDQRPYPYHYDDSSNWINKWGANDNGSCFNYSKDRHQGKYTNVQFFDGHILPYENLKEASLDGDLRYQPTN